MASIILKPYVSRREPGPLARFMLGALLVLVAMLYGVMIAVLPPQLLIWPATPIFIMIGLILWMLPDLGGVDYKRLQSVMLAYLALAVVWPSYVAFNLPGLPWISLTRGALLIALGIFLYNFSTSQEMRDKLRDSVSEMPLAIRVFWLYWATTTVSLVFSTQPSMSINKYINNQIYWTMGLFLIAMLSTREGFVMKVAKTLVVTTCIVLVYSLYEYRIRRVIWLDYMPSFLKIDPELLENLMSAQVRAGTEVYRVRGPYPVALYFSEFLTMSYPLLLHFTVKERRPLQFMALAAATFACMAVMVYTDARSAVLGMIIATLLYIFYSAIRRRKQDPLSIVGMGTVLAYPAMLVVSALIVWFWHRAHVMVLGGGQHQASSDARATQWHMAWPKIASHPLGYGVGRGNEALGYFNPAGKGTVDSYYITLMMDSGYLALPLFILMILIPAWYAFNHHRRSNTPEEELLAPFSIALINFTIVKSVLTSEANIPLAFLYIGCIFGILWRQKRRLQQADKAAVEPTPSRARQLQRQPLGALLPRQI